MWSRFHQSDTDIQDWFGSKPRADELSQGHNAVGTGSGRPWKTTPTQAVVEKALGIAMYAAAFLSTPSEAWLWASNLQVQPWDHFSGLPCLPFSPKVFLSCFTQRGSWFLQLKMTWPNMHTQICYETPPTNKGSWTLLNKEFSFWPGLDTKEPCKSQEVWVSCSGLPVRTHGEKVIAAKIQDRIYSLESARQVTV